MIITSEMIGYLAATLTTASFLPQAILTIKTKDTESLSLSMYSLFTLGVFFWLIYGVYISDKAIILPMQLLWYWPHRYFFLRFIMCYSRTDSRQPMVSQARLCWPGHITAKRKTRKICQCLKIIIWNNNTQTEI